LGFQGDFLFCSFNDLVADSYVAEEGGGMTNKEIAIALGKQVAKGKHLSCPVCSPDSMDNDQPMSSFGDEENVLFCPHCELTVDLIVNQ